MKTTKHALCKIACLLYRFLAFPALPAPLAVDCVACGAAYCTAASCSAVACQPATTASSRSGRSVSTDSAPG
jgi:hypothetical protein